MQEPESGLKMPGQYQRKTVSQADAGLDLYAFLRNTFLLSRREISRLKFTDGGLLINQTPARTSACLKAGDEVAVRIGRIPDKNPDKSPTRTDFLPTVRILYEDAWFFAADKPPGIVCHPSHGYWDSSLFDAVKWNQGELRASDAKCIGRLDKDTSGIVLYAKDQITAARLQRQLEQGSLKKTYHALCEGIFARDCDFPSAIVGTVDLPIGQDPEDRRKWKPHGTYPKRAVTHYQVLDQDPVRNVSLVQCTLETGRTHQIRIHMASLGHPLVGDPLYGHGREGESRAHLHCCRLDLLHPYDGNEIHMESKEEFY